MVSCKSTAEEVSFKWLHRRILLKDSKESSRTICTLHVNVSNIDSGSARIKKLAPS